MSVRSQRTRGNSFGESSGTDFRLMRPGPRQPLQPACPFGSGAEAPVNPAGPASLF